MDVGEFGTVRDLAIAVNLAERHVSRQLRLAYLAPEVLKRLVFGRDVSAVTVMQLSECAGLPWPDQAGVVLWHRINAIGPLRTLADGAANDGK